MFWERDSTPINGNINTIPQNAKNQKSSMDIERLLTHQRTSTYERPFTHEGNYLASYVPYVQLAQEECASAKVNVLGVPITMALWAS